MSRDPISSSLRGLDSWLTREPIDDAGSWEDFTDDNLSDYLDGLQQSGKLAPITEAPKDGEFKAVLAENGETVTAFYRDDYRLYLGEDRWQDANGDGAPDGHCRTWGADDFAGWLPPT